MRPSTEPLTRSILPLIPRLVSFRRAGTPYRKAVEILQAVQPTFPVDVLPRRPDDTAQRYRLGDPLIREALDRGKVLFEAP